MTQHPLPPCSNSGGNVKFMIFLYPISVPIVKSQPVLYSRGELYVEYRPGPQGSVFKGQWHENCWNFMSSKKQICGPDFRFLSISIFLRIRRNVTKKFPHRESLRRTPKNCLKSKMLVFLRKVYDGIFLIDFIVLHFFQKLGHRSFG